MLFFRSTQSGNVEFQENLVEIIQEFKNSSEMKHEFTGLSIEERCQVHQLTEKLNLQHSIRDRNGERVLTLTKPEAIMGLWLSKSLENIL